MTIITIPPFNLLGWWWVGLLGWLGAVSSYEHTMNSTLIAFDYVFRARLESMERIVLELSSAGR